MADVNVTMSNDLARLRRKKSGSYEKDQAVTVSLEALPKEREEHHVDAIVEVLLRQAAGFASGLSEEQLASVARHVQYRFLPAGASVCASDEEAAHFFIVLGGSVLVEEAAVHHQEGAAQVDGATRQRVVGAGDGFHHLPLLLRSRCYGYSARVADAAGASLLLLPSAEYASVLRRSMAYTRLR